ncbi:MAG: homoserine dehydrogenase [Acidobacteria bacterium]|nr:homoserine dehydrogenase [Acidobacteriota bacterium]
MQEVNVALIGLGNVGMGAAGILAGNADRIARKLGFPLRVKALCSRTVSGKTLPPAFDGVFRTSDWREAVAYPGVDIVAELVGGTTDAAAIIETAISAGKSVVTANKELMALRGAGICDRAAAAGINIAMEASVAGGIPIHNVLREGIAGDRITALFGILNGTCNYILTEIEKNGTAFGDVLAEAQRLGYAEQDPSADIDGGDARSKLAILAALAFGEQISPEAIFKEGIRRITPLDFDYADRLNHTIRLIGSARNVDEGLLLAVRPALIPKTAIMAGVTGSYNAVWVRGEYGQDTFYYGRGAGPSPTGVAVVSDLMRVAREIRAGSPLRVSPFAHAHLGGNRVCGIEHARSAYYLRFRVTDRPGIIATLASILAAKNISLDAVLQLPTDSKQNLPFVITVEPATERSIRQALDEMKGLDFLVEPPLALPIEKGV